MAGVEELVPSDISEESDTFDTGDPTVPGVFIQHGFQNEANFSQPIQGQITQVGRENIVNICTETQGFRFKISSKHKDVEAVVAINMVMPDVELDSTKTLVLGSETNQGEITAGEEIIVRIESDKQANRPGNGYTMGCGIRSITSSILTSLFERLEMIVNYFRHGSIIIGLQPKTDRAVFTLINAMEGGFIEELVRGILENEPDWNIDDASEGPIKMKIDINIPQGMFPKDFPCKKFASRKELLQELTVSMQRKEEEEANGKKQRNKDKEYLSDEIRFVHVGNKGAGKSTTRNTIFESEELESSHVLSVIKMVNAAMAPVKAELAEAKKKEEKQAVLFDKQMADLMEEEKKRKQDMKKYKDELAAAKKKEGEQTALLEERMTALQEDEKKKEEAIEKAFSREFQEQFQRQNEYRQNEYRRRDQVRAGVSEEVRSTSIATTTAAGAGAGAAIGTVLGPVGTAGGAAVGAAVGAIAGAVGNFINWMNN